MHESDTRNRNQRIIASAAATIIALACGSNYVYSAWAPQFAEKLKLSATQSNLIGLCGNLGMYSTGPPVGMFIDHQNLGPRPAVMAGAVLLGVGYFPLHQAYARGSGSVPAMCFFMFLTGWGSCLAFLASVKTSAVNWPQHRGTATAFPLAAFGLSAFFFSFLGSVLFPGDPSKFLELLSWGTFGLTFVGFFFLKTHAPATSYQAVPNADDGGPPQRLRRTSSNATDEPGTLPTANNSPAPAPRSNGGADSIPDETSSLMSDSSVERQAQPQAAAVVDEDRSHRVDIRGLKLLVSLDFWQLFSIMTILAGVGLMTINNIGNDANALWKHYDPSVDRTFLVHRQQMHVSILSVCSFVGRLISGIGSDFLVKQLHASRVWCLFVSALIFFVAQACGLGISNPHLLILVSGLSGLAYGILFGVFPSIVAETFGIRGLSQNWGFMTLAPVISSNVYNLFYGMVLDHHSVFDPDGKRTCHDGLDCYRAAYGVTLASCFVGVGVILWVIRHQHVVRARESSKGNLED